MMSFDENLKKKEYIQQLQNMENCVWNTKLFVRFL